MAIAATSNVVKRITVRKSIVGDMGSIFFTQSVVVLVFKRLAVFLVLLFILYSFLLAIIISSLINPLLYIERVFYAVGLYNRIFVLKWQA